jgi:type IV fimbrial biogenesis protein FimT
MDRQRGFTVPEMLVTIAIAAVLTGASIPTFRDLRRDAARTREVNQFLQAVHLARGEAMKRNGVASLCPSADGRSCASGGAAWDQGWILFANDDRDSPPVRDAGEELLHVYPAWGDGRIVANRSTLSFRAFGQSGVTATFAFCDDRGSTAARAVIISQTGRPRVSTRSSSGSPLDCS